MIKKPLISIGLPVFNGELFLSKTITSIIKQNFLDFELIISNNASTDKTSGICKKFLSSDTRIKYFDHLKSIGMLNNYRFVLEKAKGKYFMWIAADDLLSDKEYLSKMIKKFNEDIDYVFPDVSIIDSEDKIKRTKVMLPFLNAKTKFDFALASIKNNSQIMYSLFRTSNIKTDYHLLERFKNFSCYGEGYFVHVTAVERKGIFVKEACKLYRRHSKNQSTSVLPFSRIYCYIKYAITSLKYFYENKYFSKSQKLKLIIKMLSRQLPYLFRLTLSMIAKKFPKLNKLRLNLFNK